MLRRDSIEIYHVLLAGLLAVMLLYGLYEARVLLGAFMIRIDEPVDGATFTEPLITIAGEARHAESVLVNGRQIPLERDGTFSEAYLLSPGVNTILVEAKNKFGKTRVETEKLFLQM